MLGKELVWTGKLQALLAWGEGSWACCCFRCYVILRIFLELCDPTRWLYKLTLVCLTAWGRLHGESEQSSCFCCHWQCDYDGHCGFPRMRGHTRRRRSMLGTEQLWAGKPRCPCPVAVLIRAFSASTFAVHLSVPAPVFFCQC